MQHNKSTHDTSSDVSWLELARYILRTDRVTIKQFKSLFGCSPMVVKRIAEKINRHYVQKHLLYFLYFIKNYPTEILGSVQFDIGESTFSHAVNEMAELLHEVLPPPSWNNRLHYVTDLMFPMALTAIGTTEVTIQKPSNKAGRGKFRDEKHSHYCVKFEIAVCIGTCKIVWVAGPYGGLESEKEIIEESGFLCLPRDKIEVTYAEKTYQSKFLLKHNIITPLKCEVDGKKATFYERQFNLYVRQRRIQVERTKARIKKFSCLQKKWRHSLPLLEKVFHVICRIVNIDLSVFPDVSYLEDDFKDID